MKSDYRNYAREVALKYGLDPNIFIAQIGAESSWNPNAKSPAGALGIAQFMPGTGKMYGLTGNDFYDPYKSLDAAGQRMRDLLGQFDGNYQYALAAYNAGPGSVRKHGGVPPYEETQNYVQKILGKQKPMGQFSPVQSDPTTPGAGNLHPILGWLPKSPFNFAKPEQVMLAGKEPSGPPRPRESTPMRRMMDPSAWIKMGTAAAGEQKPQDMSQYASIQGLMSMINSRKRPQMTGLSLFGG